MAPPPEGIRRNWVHVAAPKNKQWTTAMDGVDKLKLAEADLPTPNDGEVLVKIHAVSINYRDIEGNPWVLASLNFGKTWLTQEMDSLRRRLQPLQHAGQPSRRALLRHVRHRHRRL